MLRASNNHDWAVHHKILARAEINGAQVKISNIRNFRYRSETDFDANYYDKVFDLEKISKVLVGVVPFSRFAHIAHLLTVFEFEDGSSVVFSVERRQKAGQLLRDWLTIMPVYTLIYVVGDKADVIDLREKYREKEPVHLKALNISKKQAQEVFLDFCQKLNDLAEKPEFFHFIFNSCSSNAVRHLNKALTPKISRLFSVFMPGFLHWRLNLRKQVKND